MRIYLHLLVILTLFFDLGCTFHEHQSNSTLNVDSTLTGGINDSNLKKIVEDYIQKFDGRFPDKEWLYYSLYFWRDSADSKVTIWVFTVFPNVFLLPEDRESYIYSLYEVKNRKVVFISKNKEEFKNLYTISPESLKGAIAEKEKMYEGPIYDGDMFYMTYKIIKEGDKYKFNKLKKADVSFLDRVPPDEYLH